MKTYYRLTKNGTYFGESEHPDNMKHKAAIMERVDETIGLNWRGDEVEGFYAFGNGDILTRHEYEIIPIKKRA